MHFTSKSQLEDYVKVAHYSVTYGSKDPIDADANTMQTFLKENVKVGHLADGYACKIYTNFESTPFDTFDVILRWNTTSDKLTLQCNMSFSSGGIQIVMWDKYEIASDYSSLVFISDDGSGEQSTAISKDGFAKLETHISDHFYQINYKDSSQSESGYFWRSTYDFGEELPRKDKNN